MARRIVESPPTGETFVFDDDWNEADGRVRRIEYVLQPGKSVPAHYHPGVAQTFEVVSGALTISLAGETRILQAGERATSGPGDIHTQRNDGTVPMTGVEGYDPSLDIEPFFTVLPQAIASGNPLKMAVFFADHAAVNRNIGLPLKLMVAVMAPLGRLLGYGGWYRDLVPVRRA